MGRILVRHRAIPRGRSAELDEPIGPQIVAVETDLLPVVERPDGPDYSLRSIRKYRPVQLVAGLQRSLVRDDTVAVHHRRVQQPHRVRILLRENEFISPLETARGTNGVSYPRVRALVHSEDL